MQNDKDDLDDYDVHAVTSGSVTKFKFKWTVSDISLMKKPITSPIFKIPFVSECSLRLNWDTSYKIVLELLLKTDSTDETWNAALFDKKGQLLHHFNSVKLTSTTLASPVAIPVSSLPNEVLVILCEFASTRIKSEICWFQEPLSCRDKLVADFKSLYDHPRHTDVVLRVDSEDVKAHKAILGSRSPVFKKMFQSPLTEKEENVVPISDVSLHAVKQLLEFMYTGSTELDDDVYSLYYAADKYEVLDLKSFCAEEMRSRLSVENALSVVAWADRHNDDALKASVMDFVRWNFKRVVESEDWQSYVANQGKAASALVKFCVD